MAWIFCERRGPQWKQGWKGQALSSLSLPPPPLLAVFAIVIFFLSVSTYMDYKTQVQRTENGLRFLLILLPVVIIFIALFVFSGGMPILRLPWRDRSPGSSPWGVALLVVVLLVMLSYQSSIHSKWFRPLWGS
ncbi:uncharacterized protein [Typha angustifolia]|uniref:uncharacterized protein n=1 Tax=Typha angustifolia TaxID=59011 RepID=UPI003C2BBD9C